MSEVAVDDGSGEQSAAAAQSDPRGNEQLLDVGRAARRGGVWAVISYVFTKAAGFASSIVLARLLLPQDYGLIGMTSTVLGAAQVIGNLGIGSALVHKRGNVDEHANTMWWLDMLLGLFLFSVANLLSPVAVSYYREPKLRWLILAASTNFLINPIGGAMGVLLRRDLQFKAVQRAAIVMTCVGSVLSIIFALCGARVWSFVYPYIIANLVQVAILWRLCPFRPRLKVKWGLARELVSFGWKLSLSSVFLYINENVGYILLGSLMGGTKLGLYVFACNLGTWIVQNVWVPISSIVFPTFSALQEEPEHARRMFMKLLGLVAFIGLPIVSMQWSLAPLYIGSIYSTKWLDSVTAFRFIALYGMVRAVCSPTLSLIAAMGRPDVNLKLNAAACPMLVSAVFIGSRYGINGVAAATALVHGLFTWLWLVVPFRMLKWSIGDAFKAIVPAAVCSALAGMVVSIVYKLAGGDVGSVVLLLELVLLGVLAYVGFGMMLFRGAFSDMVGTLIRAVKEARG
ncbi:MAG: lipopolysaccharide biosynthesis protein [Armatimonadota bacterium]|nr:lipopolysaccharide biosynthesis protein [Armatimonadota bacterium]